MYKTKHFFIRLEITMSRNISKKSFTIEFLLQTLRFSKMLVKNGSLATV